MSSVPLLILLLKYYQKKSNIHPFQTHFFAEFLILSPFNAGPDGLLNTSIYKGAGRTQKTKKLFITCYCLCSAEDTNRSRTDKFLYPVLAEEFFQGIDLFCVADYLED
jgi:hypothetical protein